MNRIFQVTDHLYAEVLPDGTIRWIEEIPFKMPKRRRYEVKEEKMEKSLKSGWKEKNRKVLFKRTHQESDVERFIKTLEEQHNGCAD